MVETENLTFHYNQKKQVFSFPNISLKKQEDILIIGKSGVGKTTFLHLLAGLLKPASGNIFIDGTAIHSLSASKLDLFRGQHIGLVFQKNYAIRSLNVFENIQARLFFSKNSLNPTAIDQLLRELGLIKYKKQKVKELSEGQLQRLGIALSVIHNPNCLLYTS